MRRRISQREAVKLEKRVRELESAIEAQRRTWSQEYFGATQVASANWEPLDSRPVAIRTARKLGHAVVVIAQDDGLVRFMALPHPKV